MIDVNSASHKNLDNQNLKNNNNSNVQKNKEQSNKINEINNYKVFSSKSFVYVENLNQKNF